MPVSSDQSDNSFVRLVSPSTGIGYELNPCGGDPFGPSPTRFSAESPSVSHNALLFSRGQAMRCRQRSTSPATQSSPRSPSSTYRKFQSVTLEEHGEDYDCERLSTQTRILFAQQLSRVFPILPSTRKNSTELRFVDISAL